MRIIFLDIDGVLNSEEWFDSKEYISNKYNHNVESFVILDDDYNYDEYATCGIAKHLVRTRFYGKDDGLQLSCISRAIKKLENDWDLNKDLLWEPNIGDTCYRVNSNYEYISCFHYSDNPYDKEIIKNFGAFKTREQAEVVRKNGILMNLLWQLKFGTMPRL